jgi:hypothetical protein
LVDWLSGGKYGFIPYLQNNWTLHVSTIVTFLNYDYNLPNPDKPELKIDPPEAELMSLCSVLFKSENTPIQFFA